MQDDEPLDHPLGSRLRGCSRAIGQDELRNLKLGLSKQYLPVADGDFDELLRSLATAERKMPR